MNAIMITNKLLSGHLIVAILLTLIVQCWGQRLLTREQSTIEKTREQIVALDNCGMPPTDGSGWIDPRIGGKAPSNVDPWANGCKGQTLEGLITTEKVFMGQKERDIIISSAIEAIKAVDSYSAIAELVEMKLHSFIQSSTTSRKMWISVVGAKNGFFGAAKPAITNEFFTFSIGELKFYTLSVTVMTRCKNSNLVATPRPTDQWPSESTKGPSWMTESPKDQWPSEPPKGPSWMTESPKDQWPSEPTKGPSWIAERPNPDESGDWNHDPTLDKSSFDDSFNSFVLENLNPVVLSNGLKSSKKQNKVCSYLIDKISNNFDNSIDPKSWICFTGPHASISFKAPTNEVPSLKIKMGPMRVKLMRMPKPEKSEAEVIAEARLNIDRVDVNMNMTRMYPQYVTLFTALGQEAVQKHSTYYGISNHIQQVAKMKWPLIKFDCVAGLESGYEINYWYKDPYLITFTISQLRIIAYAQS